MSFYVRWCTLSADQSTPYHGCSPSLASKNWVWCLKELVFWRLDLFLVIPIFVRDETLHKVYGTSSSTTLGPSSKMEPLTQLLIVAVIINFNINHCISADYGLPGCCSPYQEHNSIEVSCGCTLFWWCSSPRVFTIRFLTLNTIVISKNVTSSQQGLPTKMKLSSIVAQWYVELYLAFHLQVRDGLQIMLQELNMDICF